MQNGTKAYTDAQQKQEKKSGTNTRVREFLALLLDMMGKDDKPVASKLDACT